MHRKEKLLTSVKCRQERHLLTSVKCGQERHLLTSVMCGEERSLAGFSNVNVWAEKTFAD